MGISCRGRGRRELHHRREWAASARTFRENVW
jgi:hypothetical protein